MRSHCSQFIFVKTDVVNFNMQDKMQEYMRQPLEDGQPPTAPVEVVRHVLGEKSTFLQNLGLKQTKRNASVSMQRLEEIQHSHKNVEEQLRKENESFKNIIETQGSQIDAQRLQIDEQQSKIQDLSRKLEETDGMVRMICRKFANE